MPCIAYCIIFKWVLVICLCSLVLFPSFQVSKFSSDFTRFLTPISAIYTSFLHFLRVRVKRKKTDFRNFLTEIQLNFSRFSEKLPYLNQLSKLRHFNIISHHFLLCQAIFGNFLIFLALSLFMALALGANYHNSTVSFDNFALIAHRFYRRSYFHNFSPCYFHSLP